MRYFLAENIQVRKESWGLLFYAQLINKVFFLKSKDWLSSETFDGSWTFERITQYIAVKAGISNDIAKLKLQMLINDLLKNGLIVDELC